MLAFDLVWIAAAAVVVIILAIAAWIVSRSQAADRRQERLRRAFDRASRVQGAGTGEQGKPYSLYGPRAWDDR